MFVSNHQSLIKACYPLDLSGDPLSSPISNPLGKLTFYAAGRPKKLPKVAAVLLERAERDGRPSSGPKGRAGLAVTVEIMKELVSECRTELRCFADQALRVVELGLTRREGQQRDTQLEARAASLFHAVSTFTTGPFLGLNDALGKQYLRCLALISSLAQLSPNQTVSRSIALAAIKGAVASELLYSPASDYDSQIEEIIPALLFNCLNVPVTELHEHSNVSDAAASTSNLSALSSRKSPSIDPPSTPPTAAHLACDAVHSLRAISRLSHGGQLTSKLSAMGSWLNRYKNGALWKEREFLEWLGSSVIGASPVQYRAGVVAWWLEQVVEIDDTDATPKSENVLYTLSHILRGPTTVVGLGIGGVLAQLTSLIVQRASLGEDDPLTLPLLSTITSLASSHVYYVDQLNDVVSDLIDTLRNVKNGRGVAAHLREDERKRAMRQLVGALRQVLIEAEKGNGEVQVAVPVMNGANGTGTNGTNGTSNSRPPLLEDYEGTIRGNGISAGAGQAQGLKTKKESNGSAGGGQLDALGRPIMRVAGAGRRHRISPEVFQESLFLLTDVDAAVRNDYERALLVYVGKEMEVALHGSDDEPAIDPSQEVSRFYRELHAAIYELATSISLVLDPTVTLSGSLASLPPLARSVPSTSTRASSKSSRRRRSTSSAPVSPSIANAADYSALVEIIRTVQLRRSVHAVLEGVPMLLALQKAAQRWETEAGVERGMERAQACREIAASGLAAIGEAWEVVEVQRVADQALATMRPSVVPPFDPARTMSSDFVASASTSRPLLSSAIVVDALAASRSLQACGGTGLSNVLNSPWSPDLARKRSDPSNTYSNSSRSVSNLGSTLRVSSTPDQARSFRAPSLADLQVSLGRSASVRTSATPSIASTSGTVATYNTQRRTTKAKAEAVLSRLNVRNSTRRTSVSTHTPPYLAAAN